MSARLILLLVVTAAFGALSAMALMDVGYLGIIEPHFQAWGPGQVFTDLVIALIIALVFISDDARSRGINPWPFVAITLVAGSFGPLLYLIVRELRAPARRPASA